MVKHPTSHERFAEIELERGSERNFGLVFAGFFLLLLGLALWNGRSAWVWAGLSAAFAATALVAPGLLRPLNRFWHAFGMALGQIVSPLVMGVVFFLVVTPIAIYLRATGKDPLRLKWERTARTYWVMRNPPGPTPKSMPLQF